ncbi:MmgE/PrpD family protein [Acuticoccus kandeliae]|uniref:MmgE/PrpD family protein n=1 Tax=Acuticoccus kandeliae TaxID=2073160 RepID=UPI0013005F79|nr:MmgE/PrpD family protein [Acuticoccus kandeliae]
MSRTLAAFAVDHDVASIPGDVIAEAKRSLVNFVGCAVGGAPHATVEIALRALGPHVPGPHRLLGRRERLDPFHAALVNGMSSAVLDFDATQAKFTNIHPSGPVVPAVLAVAGMRPVTGRDALAATIVGVEVACRVANGLFDRDNPGWHVTGVAGGFGAAAAAGRLLGLDADRMVHAFSIAATQAAGLREMYGTMCKSFTPGRTAQNGLTAALLAEAGFDGAEHPIEGRTGFARVLTGRTDVAAITEGLGVRHEILLNTYKPFPCAIVTHAAIDGCLRLKHRHGLAPGDITRVHITVSPLAEKLAGKTNPATELEAKFSTVHLAALALTRGAVTARGIAAVDDPALLALRPHIETMVNEAFAKNAAAVTIETLSGAAYTERVESALGSLDNPMDDAALDEKFTGLAEPVLGAAQAARLLTLCRSVDALDDVSALLEAAAPHEKG